MRDVNRRDHLCAAALISVLLLALTSCTTGQVKNAALTQAIAVNASNYQQLVSAINNPKVGSIVLYSDIVLSQPIVISRTSTISLSIGSISRFTLRSINCAKIGNAPAFELRSPSILYLTYIFFQNCVTALKVATPQLAPGVFPNVLVDNVDFAGVSDLQGDAGGAISWQVQAGDLTVQYCNFKEGKARKGGAIFATGGGNLTINNCTFVSNKAAEEGGAIMLGANLRVAIGDCQFENNAAEQGGGAVVIDTSTDISTDVETPNATFVQISASNFTHNSAVNAGGALLCKNCDQLQVINCDFKNNSAPGEQTAGLGGAIAIVANRSDFDVVGSNFSDNTAAFGGAIFLNNSCPANGGNCSPSILLQTASANRATRSGHFLHSMDPGAIHVCCGNPDLQACTKQDLNSCSAAAPDLLNKTIAGVPNVAGPQSGIKILSAKLLESSLDVKLEMWGQQPASQLVMPDPVTITLGLITANQQAMVLGGNTTVATYTGVVDWPPLQIFPPPNSNFDIVVNATGVLGAMLSARQTVAVEPCPVGSYNDTSKGVCDNCGTHNLFSLSPQVPCFNCINGAVCRKGLMLPSRHYWMANMLLPQFQWCPLDGACKFKSRESILLNTTLQFQHTMTQTPESFSPAARALNDTFMTSQCAPGYTGTFCGQCAPGYGLSGRKCVKCSGSGGTAALFLLSMFFLVSIISVTMLTHVKGARLLTAGEAARVFISGGGISGGVLHSSGVLNDHGNDMHDGSPWHVDEDAQRPHLFDLALVLDNAHKLRQHGRPPSGMDGRPMSTRSSAGVVVPTLNARQMPLEPTAEEQQAAEYFLLTAMIKILVTYVQLVGMLPGLKLRWPAELRRVLFFVDYTSCAGWLPLSCAWSGSETSKAIGTTILYVLVFPACVVIMTVTLWSVVLRPLLTPNPAGRDSEAMGDLVTRRSQTSFDEPTIVFHTSFENRRSLAKKRAVAAAVQCVYYLYPFVSMKILQVFVCMQVGRMSRPLWEAYKSHLPSGLTQVDPGFYWLQSSAVRCFSDPAHRNLAITVGVLGICFWIIGIPLLLLWGAYRHRNSNRLSNGALSWGFVYLEYRPELWYWEFLVCMRKLSVMVCTQLLAFGRGPLSAGQLYASMVFVVLGWLGHEVFRPFTDIALASMDRCSSFGVIVALIVIAFKLNSQADSPIDTVLMVVVVLVVVGAVLFLLARITLQTIRIHKAWKYFQEEARGMGGKDGRPEGGARKHIVGVDARPGMNNSTSDWLGTALDSFLERATGLFRRNRNPLNDLAKRAWTRPVRQANSLEREMETTVPSRVAPVMA